MKIAGNSPLECHISPIIMIAAGSLFTSCVTNTEPQGIKDLREAKAGYLDALANLRAADAEKVKAEATLVQAQAATEQALAALKQALAKEQEIKNDKAAAENAIALEKARKDAEVYLAQQEKVLAEAEEALRAYLVKVEEQSKQLTTTEYQIVVAYTAAYKAVIDKQKAVRDAEAYLYSVTYTETGELSVEAQKAEYEQTIATNKATIATNQAKYDEWSSVAEEQIAKYDFWAAEYQKLQDSIKNFGYDIAKIQQDSAVAALENKEAFDKFFKELTDAQAEVEKAVNAAKTGFSMVYSNYSTPKNPFVIASTAPVVETFQKAVNQTIDQTTKFIVDVDKNKGESYLSVNVNDEEVAYNIIFGDEKNPDAASLAGIIDALKRDSVVVDKIINDTTGLGAAVAAVKAEYKALKDTLEKGVAAYKPIADAKAAAKTAKEAYTAANDAFEADTTALIKSIKDFVAALNEYNNTLTKRTSDSEKVFNAFVAVMTAREKALEYTPAKGAENLNYFKYYKPELGENLQPKPVLDSVKFSELQFAGIKQKGKYAGSKSNVGDFEWNNKPFQSILNNAFGDINFFSDKFGQEEYSEIKFDDLEGETTHFQKLFFDKYWANYVTNNDDWGKIIVVGNGVYVSTKVGEAKDAWDTAEANIPAAQRQFYTKIYSTFWGVTLDEEHFTAAGYLKNAATDSIRIKYTEKTFTDPYVIPVFTAVDAQNAIFTPAKDKVPAKFVWTNLDYNKTNSELKLIEQELGKNYIKVDENFNFTLYAKTLAAEQIAGLVEDYKENTKALAELEEVVAAVEEAYAAALLKVADAEVVADSVVTAYLGEDIVKKAIAAKDAKTARGIWNSTNWQKYIVNVKAADKLKDFTATFCEGGKYKLGGQQLASAEANIPHYAEVVAEHAAAKAFIDAAKTNCTELSNILQKYVDAISGVEGYTTSDDPVKVAQFIKTYFEGMLNDIQGLITTAEGNIATAEGSIQKLEAGFDTKQVTIAYAEDLLAKAQAELEQAELELAVAEEAYKAVLEAHGITE